MYRKNLIGSTLLELGKIHSTNDYAMQLIEQGQAQHGLGIRADYQSKGKGRQGNKWLAEESKNLLLSVVLELSDLKLEQQFLLNAATCMACCNLLMETYELPNVYAKWPNDIFVEGRKIGGILIENIVRGNQWTYAVVGIGLNINQTQFATGIDAISIKQLKQKDFGIKKVCKQLFKELNHKYDMLGNQKEELMKEYNQNLLGRNELISFKQKFELRSGKLVGVKNNGQIIIEYEGQKRSYTSAEIQLEIK